MSKHPTDEELRRAIEGAPRHLSYRGLAQLLTLTFGRSFSKSGVGRAFKRLGIRKFKPSKLDADVEQLGVVEALLLAGEAPGPVLAQLRARFGTRAIGRSSIYRHRGRMHAKGRFARPADGGASPR